MKIFISPKRDIYIIEIQTEPDEVGQTFLITNSDDLSSKHRLTKKVKLVEGKFEVTPDKKSIGKVDIEITGNSFKVTPHEKLVRLTLKLER